VQLSNQSTVVGNEASSIAAIAASRTGTALASKTTTSYTMSLFSYDAVPTHARYTPRYYY
jgi:hypothetical protein